MSGTPEFGAEAGGLPQDGDLGAQQQASGREGIVLEQFGGMRGGVGNGPVDEGFNLLRRLEARLTNRRLAFHALMIAGRVHPEQDNPLKVLS